MLPLRYDEILLSTKHKYFCVQVAMKQQLN
nr:MAG TPA: hypothetical protein [Bacteriophage sp.]